jgi:hypothetical protein
LVVVVVVVVESLSEMEAESVYKGEDAMCESGRKRSGVRKMRLGTEVRICVDRERQEHSQSLG